MWKNYEDISLFFTHQAQETTKTKDVPPARLRARMI